MRPIPRSRHLPAVLLLAAAAAAMAYAARHDHRLSDAQRHAAAAAMKRQDPDLYPHDAVFGPSRLWRFDTPVFQALMASVLAPTGYQDPVLPFRVAAGVVALIYLLGMYALLFRQTRSWSVSVFVAILSSTVIYALGGSFWGVGSLASVQPAAICTAAAPFIMMAFLRCRRGWRVLAVFAAIGALGNLDPATAMNLTIVLLIVVMGLRRFSPSSWLVALACGAVALAAALPYAWYCHALRQELMPPGAPVVAPETIHEAIKIAQWDLLYPGMLHSGLNWPLFLLLLVVPATVVLYRVERYPIRDFGIWAWSIGAVLFVTFALQGLSQLIGMLRGTGPPILLFVQASGLVMLPLYVLLAHVLTSVFRVTRRNRSLVRWACAAFAAAWIIPSSGFRVARYAALEAATMFMAERAKPPKVLEHRRKLRRHRELVTLGRWARGTDRRAVFLFDNIEFRVLSRRSIVASADDLRYFYYHAPWRLREWVKTVVGQSRLFSGTADLGAIRKFVADLVAADRAADGRGEWAAAKPPMPGRFSGVTEWYIVLPFRRARRGELGDLSPVYSGEFHQVYRLGVPGRATSPAGPDNEGKGSARKDNP